MHKPEPTKQVRALVKALEERGVYAEMEHWDGHKHIDIFVPSIKLYIEVDGIWHDIRAKQIVADLKRDHYSNKGMYYTKRFSNHAVAWHLNAIADAIVEITRKDAAEPTPIR